MNICGNNLIPIFITVIICGVMFIYVNSRLANLEHSIEKQQRVLTAFITNVQNDIRGGGLSAMPASAGASAGAMPASASAMPAGASAMPSGAMPSSLGKMISANHLATPEALAAVKRDKIVVSDDDCSEAESSDDESISDEESSSDEENEQEEIKIIKLNAPKSEEREEPMVLNFEVLSSGPPQMFMTHLGSPMQMSPQMFMEVLSHQNQNSSSSVSSSSICEIVDDTIELTSLDMASFGLDKTDTAGLSIVDVDGLANANHSISNGGSSSSSESSDPAHYEQMRVDDLRKIVLEKNIAPKEEVKKLKKPELLALLKKA